MFVASPTGMVFALAEGGTMAPLPRCPRVLLLPLGVPPLTGGGSARGPTIAAACVVVTGRSNRATTRLAAVEPELNGSTDRSWTVPRGGGSFVRKRQPKRKRRTSLSIPTYHGPSDSWYPPPPVSSKQYNPQNTRLQQDCAVDTPFGTQSMRCLNPAPNEFGPIKLRSERKCSLGKAFVGKGGGCYLRCAPPRQHTASPPPPGPCTAPPPPPCTRGLHRVSHAVAVVRGPGLPLFRTKAYRQSSGG